MSQYLEKKKKRKGKGSQSSFDDEDEKQNTTVSTMEKILTTRLNNAPYDSYMMRMPVKNCAKYAMQVWQGDATEKTAGMANI